MTETDPSTTQTAPDHGTVTDETVDAVLAAAVEQAREAAVAVGGDAVGEHRGVRAEGELLATHAFESTLPGYRGWYWAVTVTRDTGDERATVDEVVQLPGDGALLAPAWVPWDQRVRPGDLSPGDLLPATEDDVRLVPAYTDSGDPAVEAVGFELGIGRERVLSRDGRELAADRWYEGDRGPSAPMARQAPATCGTCGFLVRLAGSLSIGFGVCANEVTDTDGQVVSVEYGCGAHSQIKADAPSPVEVAEVVYDDGDEIESKQTATEPSDGAAHAAVAGHDGEPEQAE